MKRSKKTPTEWSSGGVFFHSGKGAERAKNPEMGFYLGKIFSRKMMMKNGNSRLIGFRNKGNYPFNGEVVHKLVTRK